MAGQPEKRKRERRSDKRDFVPNIKDFSKFLRRPTEPLWPDPEALGQAVSEYFKDCKDRDVSYTVSGLVFWLGFESRQSFFDYSKRDDDLGYIMRRAKQAIEQQRAEQLIDGETTPPQAKIFDLKCNFGWQEPAQVQEINNPDGNLGTKVVAMLPERPPSLEEWQEWYQQMMSSRSEPEVVEASSQETQAQLDPGSESSDPE